MIFTGGAYNIENQAVHIRADRAQDPVGFASIAYTKLSTSRTIRRCRSCIPAGTFCPYRQGFGIVTRHAHRSYFRKVDEAVIEKLTTRFVQERLREHPLTKDAIAGATERREILQRHVARPETCAGWIHFGL